MGGKGGGTGWEQNLKIHKIVNIDLTYFIYNSYKKSQFLFYLCKQYNLILKYNLLTNDW